MIIIWSFKDYFYNIIKSTYVPWWTKWHRGVWIMHTLAKILFNTVCAYSANAPVANLTSDLQSNGKTYPTNAKCNAAGKPGVFTQVNQYISWINTNMNWNNQFIDKRPLEVKCKKCCKSEIFVPFIVIVYFVFSCFFDLRFLLRITNIMKIIFQLNFYKL